MTAMQGEVSLQGYRTRLDAAFASNAPRAVILRRGPKKHFHLISWDLRNDTFIHGQWMKGVVRLCDLSPSGNKLLYWAAQHHNSAAERARRRPSVTGEEQEGSPRFEPLAQRGRDMAEFAKRHPKRRVPRYLRAPDGKSQGKSAPRADTGTWTAISRPPYFSALAVWPSFGTWTGEATFAPTTRLCCLNLMREWSRKKMSGDLRSLKCRRILPTAHSATLSWPREQRAIPSRRKPARRS